MADSEIKIPAADSRNRRRTVSPRAKIAIARIMLFIRRILGIRLDFRVKPRSAKLSALRAEDRIINPPPSELPIVPPELIYCNVYRLAKIVKALENSQIFTVRVLIFIKTRQIEKITISAIRRY